MATEGAGRHIGGRRGAVVAALVGSLVLAGCQASVGAMSCPDWLAGSAAERTAAFHDALEARNLEFRGPSWQADMSVATAESYCRSSPDRTLDDALDFVGAPEGSGGIGRVLPGAVIVALIVVAGIYVARGQRQPTSSASRDIDAVQAADRVPDPDVTDHRVLELLRDLDGSVESATHQAGGEIDEALRRLLDHGLIEMLAWDRATITPEGARFLADPDARLSPEDDEPTPVVPSAEVTFSQQTGCFTAKLGHGHVVFDRAIFELELPDQPPQTVELTQLHDIEVETGLESGWLRFTFDEHSRTIAFPARYQPQAAEIAHAVRSITDPRSHGLPDGETGL